MSSPLGRVVARRGDRRPWNHRRPLLADLDPSQRAAVTHDAPTLAILAPAGSGKTRVLTRRVAWLVEQRRVSAGHVLAVTFTRKAAGELSQRLGRLGVRQVTAGTFHSLALAQLRRHSLEQGREPPAVLGAKGRIIGPIVGGRGPGARVAVLEIAGEIEWAKARLVGPGDYAAAVLAAGRHHAAPGARDRGDLRALRAGEAQASPRRLRRPPALVRADDRDATRRSRRRSASGSGRSSSTSSRTRAPRRCASCAPGSAIVPICASSATTHRRSTRSRAPTPGRCATSPRTFPAGVSVRLGANYRSTAPIVAAAAAVLDRPRLQIDAPRGDGPAPEILAVRRRGRRGGRASPSVLRQAHARGVSWSDMAVLYRTNAQSVPFETALPGRRACRCACPAPAGS